MGILNLTPDSFSDGGRYPDVDAAVRHAAHMVEVGADAIDVGGESTRPGAARVGAGEQQSRVRAVIAALADRLPARVQISVDTTRSEVAAMALASGARIVNDLSAGTEDPAMFDLVAARGATVIVAHAPGVTGGEEGADYVDVLAEVMDFLQRRTAAARRAGIPADRIWVDPGIGFRKRRGDNLRLLAHLGEIGSLGYPVLVGVSRKRFMGSLVGEVAPTELVPATCAITALGVWAGVRGFRVHDVRENRQVADVIAAIRRRR